MEKLKEKDETVKELTDLKWGEKLENHRIIWKFKMNINWNKKKEKSKNEFDQRKEPWKWKIKRSIRFTKKWPENSIRKRDEMSRDIIRRLNKS